MKKGGKWIFHEPTVVTFTVLLFFRINGVYKNLIIRLSDFKKTIDYLGGLRKESGICWQRNLRQAGNPLFARLFETSVGAHCVRPRAFTELPYYIVTTKSLAFSAVSS